MWILSNNRFPTSIISMLIGPYYALIRYGPGKVGYYVYPSNNSIGQVLEVCPNFIGYNDSSAEASICQS